MMDGNRSLDATVIRVRELVAEIAGVDVGEVADDAPLFDTDHEGEGPALDSLDALKLALALAEEYGLDTDWEADMSGVRTVRDVAAYVQALIAPGGEP